MFLLLQWTKSDAAQLDIPAAACPFFLTEKEQAEITESSLSSTLTRPYRPYASPKYSRLYAKNEDFKSIDNGCSDKATPMCKLLIHIHECTALINKKNAYLSDHFACEFKDE